jgi:AcrR family transcriptional regulator
MDGRAVPKRVDHDERRRQIGEALLRIAADRGLRAASMREVAAEAGVSLRLVQYYFHTKDELLLGAFGYLGEQLSARVRERVRALGMPTNPRRVLYGTLTAILPTDEESRRITRTYTAYFTHLIDGLDGRDGRDGLDGTPVAVAQRGLAYPEALERFLAGQVRAAQEAGDVPAAVDATAVAAGLLAMTNGLGSSVLAGQRDGAAALAILTYHLDGLFGG